ncbi:HNH endonuclease [Peribacillus frigoritolerans]|uniref:HNH endonuclease n=1 Tax=Peribacillus castrilensis TaxID=2897690 RepID=UPI003DA5FE50
MQLLKACSRCGDVIAQGNGAMCDECREKSKTRHRDYDKTGRNKQSANVYNTKAWRDVRHRVKVRDLYMCRLCYGNTRIKSMHTVHHIIPVEEDVKKEFIYNPKNLISLCQSCHLQTHVGYEKSKMEKENLQEYLRELVEQGVGEG